METLFLSNISSYQNRPAKSQIYPGPEIDTRNPTQIIGQTTGIYDYTVEYKKGKENVVADALSRITHKMFNMFSSVAVPVWVTEVLQSYKNNTKCQELMQQLTIAPTTSTNFSLTKNILRYKGRIYIGNNTTLRDKIIDSMHNS